MKRMNVLILSLTLLVGAGNVSLSYAQQQDRKTTSSKNSTSKRKVVKKAQTKVVKKLPAKKSTVKHAGISYYASAGKYYRKLGTKYLMVTAPIGLRVAALPVGRIVFHFNNHPYYCYDGAIYSAVSNNEYEVVTPEVGMVVPQLPEVNVREVSIDDKIYFEFDNILYKQIPTQDGLQYEVIGTLAD